MGGWGRLVSILCFRQNAVAFFARERAAEREERLDIALTLFAAVVSAGSSARRRGAAERLAWWPQFSWSPRSLVPRLFGTAMFARQREKPRFFRETLPRFLRLPTSKYIPTVYKSGPGLDKMVGIGCRRFSLRACGRWYVIRA